MSRSQVPGKELTFLKNADCNCLGDSDQVAALSGNIFINLLFN